jgi:hypothetical protein
MERMYHFLECIAVIVTSNIAFFHWSSMVPFKTTNSVGIRNVRTLARWNLEMADRRRVPAIPLLTQLPSAIMAAGRDKRVRYFRRRLLSLEKLPF